jgi:sigma-B regulation protein RsbU (phosphoserine phosphatase)
MLNEVSHVPARALEKLALLNEIGRLVISSTNLDRMFEDAARLLRKNLGVQGVQYVMIGTIEHEKGQILTRGTDGISPDLVARYQSQGIEQGVIGEVVESGKTVVINDVSKSSRYLGAIPGTRSEICVPLKIFGKVAGFLNIENDRLGAFEPADVEIFEAVANFLGQAMKRIQAEDALQNSLQAMQLLNEVSVELVSILDLDKLLDKIAQIARRFIDYELFAILLVDEDAQELVWKTSVGYSEESRRELGRLSLHEGVIGRVIRTRAPILVPDVTADSDYKPARTLSGVEPQSELAIPLMAKNRIVGVLVLESTRKGYFGPQHLRLMTPLAAQIAVAVENASLYEGKTRDALTAQVMNEIGKEMTAILELDELLNRIAALIRRIINYEVLGIFFYRPETEIMELKVSIGYAEETMQQGRALPMGKGLLGHAGRERRTILSTDLANDARVVRAKTLDGQWTQSAVAVPIISRDRLLGGIVVESSDPRFFKTEQVQMLETLASQMAVTIDNAQLFQQLLAKEQKLEADFGLARDLQASMLPLSMPETRDFDFAAIYKPAESLGGDYYDFLWLDSDHLGLAIGDVSGKGVAAAMTMAATRSALRFAARVNSSPSQVLYHVNRRLYRDVKNRTYVSLFYGILDIKTRWFRWSNGGHFPPVLIHADGRREYLSKGGTVLALFDKSRYAAAQAQLRSGDVLCFYTDGVIELWNQSEEEFGRQRLEEILSSKASQPAKEILKALTSEMKRFTRGAGQHDDIAAFILKVAG